MREKSDRSSHWLIKNHGNSILWLGGTRNIVSWSAVKSELVQPKQLPDGLIEAEAEGQDEPVLFLTEIATYPEKRVVDQMRDNAMHVVLAKGKLPEMLVIVLRPKGQYRIPNRARWTSPLGSAQLSLKWKVVELWDQSAEQLLAANDVGLIPWVLLTKFDEPPETMFWKCRDRIEQQATKREKDKLLAVSRGLAGLRFPGSVFLEIFCGREQMIEFPEVAEIVVEKTAAMRHKDILLILSSRLGVVPSEISDQLKPITDQARLDLLVRAALDSATFDEFRKKLVRPKSRNKKS